MVLNKIPTFQEVKDWVNTNTATSVNGETGDVVVDTSAPITSKDHAETFAESGVSLEHTDSIVNGESVIIYGYNIVSTTSRTEDNLERRNKVDFDGIQFNPNTSISELTLEPSKNSTGYTRGIITDTSGNVLGSGQPDKRDTIHITGLNLSSGTTYYAALDGNGQEWDPGYLDGASFPYTGGSLDITGGVYAGGIETQSNAYAVSAISEVNGEKSSGSATVEWPEPSDIYRWDAATFNADTDGETVDVFIEESTDGGSTWTEIAGPISRGQPINAEPDSEVRLRADFQRDDVSNNPRLNSVYRRWEV